MEGICRNGSCIKKLLKYSKFNELLPALNINEIEKFEKSNHISLPSDLIRLLKSFDGGEILIPGPVLFGLKDNPARKTIRDINSSANRNKFSIPSNYLIIAKTNYGDYICIDLNSPYKVIQWAHENDELYCDWNNLEEWLTDNIDSFEKYMEDKT